MTDQKINDVWSIIQYAKGFEPPIAYNEEPTIAIFSESKHGDIAYIHSPLWGKKEAKRHARLIAAAPELLEALRNIVGNSMLDETECEFIAVANAAIAKATGES